MITVFIVGVVMFVNDNNKSYCGILLGKQNGEYNNSRRTSSEEVTTEEKNITS